MPAAVEHNTVWLVPEHAGDGSVSDVAVRVRDYERILAAQPTDAEDGSYKAVVIVFTDLPLDRAGAFFDDVLREVAVQSYVEDGLAMGGSFKGNEAGAIYNPSFKPFTSPVPFLLSREAVVSDWKFFIDDDAWLERWAQRFGESGAEALARELRPLPWRAGGESRSRSEEQFHLGGAFGTISSYERRSS
jgi:hypothetical protein